MDMQSPTSSNGFGSSNKLRRKMNLNLPHHEYHNCPTEQHENYFHSADDILSSQSSENRQRNSSHSSASGKSSSLSAQDELVEIINDFKNNVFTIAEVEKLVESWQSRHDVQQSFKEKQRQLNEMREEYEKIQQSMKEDLKRATPFERIRKFFTRGKNKNCTGACKAKTVSVSSSSPTTSVSHRPASSLSLHSSCSSTSSGRMSTGSGTSLGDSGTHSDSDDRKINEIARHDLRSKMLSGRLYTEIPQRDTTKYSEEAEGEKQRLLECAPSSSGTVKPHYLHRSNSLIQETTIVEEVDENLKNSQDQTALVATNIAANEEKEITMVDIHNIPCDTCGSKTEPATETQPNKLPLPPPGNPTIEESTKVPLTVEVKKGKNMTTPEQLIIIEGNEDITSFEHSSQIPKTSKPELEGDPNIDKSPAEGSAKGFVKNIVSFIENESNFNMFDTVDDVCEHILDEAETEVVFELPDYVNVTSPPIPPRPACENISS